MACEQASRLVAKLYEPLDDSRDNGNPAAAPATRPPLAVQDALQRLWSAVEDCCMTRVATYSIEHQRPDIGPEDEAVTQFHFDRRLWGYDPAQVDAFVERTASRLDDALAACTPDAAVKEALNRVGEETKAVLVRAHQVAAEITALAQRDAAELAARSQQGAAELAARSQQEAAQLAARSQQEAAQLAARSQQEATELCRRAECEAAATWQEADARVTALYAEIDTLSQERWQVLNDIECISQQLYALVREAVERMPPNEEAVVPLAQNPEGEEQDAGETPGAAVAPADDAGADNGHAPRELAGTATPSTPETAA
jgi:DivIVA domain-containing protein